MFAGPSNAPASVIAALVGVNLQGGIPRAIQRGRKSGPIALACVHAGKGTNVSRRSRSTRVKTTATTDIANIKTNALS